MRHAEGVRQHGAKPPAHAFNSITRGWAGGAQHRSDSAARSTPTRAQRGTRPKEKSESILKPCKITLISIMQGQH
ncbi:MAG: hypothetical protein NZ455_11805 [Bacteroidia bacterium]|nr:hypothetical protein [Bacteroidia bacterium]MDW8348140.1 hypothetical protein [Bacteroidia bacterium]